MRNVCVLAVVLGAAAVLGCSSSSSSGGGGSDAGGDSTASEGGRLSATQACSDIAAARCTKLQTCAPATITAGTYGGMAACEASFSAACTDSLMALSTGNSPTVVEGCAQAIAGWSCADYENVANIPAACVQVKGQCAGGKSVCVRRAMPERLLRARPEFAVRDVRGGPGGRQRLLAARQLRTGAGLFARHRPVRRARGVERALRQGRPVRVSALVRGVDGDRDGDVSASWRDRGRRV